MSEARKLDPVVLGAGNLDPFFQGISPNRAAMFASHQKQMPGGGFKETDMCGGCGVIVEVKEPTVIPAFKLSDIPGAPKSV